MMGMMNDDKKKMATLILGFGKEKPSKDGEEMSSSEKEPEQETGSDYAGEVMKAMKSGDKKAFKSALKAFVYECMNGDMSEDEEESEY